MDYILITMLHQHNIIYTEMMDKIFSIKKALILNMQIFEKWYAKTEIDKKKKTPIN